MKSLASRLALAGALCGLVLCAACDNDQRAMPVTPSAAAPTTPTTTVIEGTIDGLSSPDTIVLSGQRIQLDPRVVIRSGSMPVSFADLRLGARSRVTAESDGGSIRATLVDVLDPVGTATRLHGVVSGVAVDANGFQFQMGSQTVRGNGDTQVVEGTRPALGSSLHDGQIVDIDGLQRADYVYAALVAIRANDAAPAPTPSPSPSPGPSPSPSPSPAPSPGPSPSPSPGPSPSPSPGPAPGPIPTPPIPGGGNVTVGGTVNSVSGSCPAIVFTMGGTAVVTDNNTSWTGGTCASLAPGGTAHATGTRNGNTIAARQVSFP